MDVYEVDVKGKMKRFFSWLSEKDRRRYAAVEVAKLGHGGVEYIARVLACAHSSGLSGNPPGLPQSP